MTKSHLANSRDLALWAERIDSRAHFPALMRRLIVASCDLKSPIDLRAGESSEVHGYDAVVMAATETTYVPAGRSIWEFGTSRDAGEKAQSDYAKRSRETDEESRRATAYIFVTPRIWKEKSSWSARKNSENKWCAVRAYDGDDLETWLLQCPGVHLWISQYLNKQTPALQDLESWWKAWSEMTAPALTPEVVLAGRALDVEELISKALGPEVQLVIRCGSSEEACAALASAIATLPIDRRESLYSNFLVLTRDELLPAELIHSTKHRLYIITPFENDSLKSQLLQTGHKIIYIPDPGAMTTADEYIIKPVATAEFSKAIQFTGVTADLDHLSKLARVSFKAFRRAISRAKGLLSPSWATHHKASVLLPALLAQSWQDENQFDAQVIADIASMDYQYARQELEKLRSVTDPPLRRLGTRWSMLDVAEGFTLLGRMMTASMSRRFKNAAVDIITEEDPSLSLPIKERWIKSPHLKRRKYSDDLRRGVASSAAFLARRGPDHIVGQQIFFDIMMKSRGTAKGWENIADLLPLIAEGNPDIFCDSCDKALSGDMPLFKSLFSDTTDDLFSSSPHVPLLWALESLAWDARYLSRSAVILARLHEIDPGGRLANRPLNSLVDIFLSWMPHTSATVSERLEVVDHLRSNNPSISWKLLERLLPSKSTSTSGTHRPTWADWAIEQSRGASQRDHRIFTDGVTTRMLADAGKNLARWSTLVTAASSWTRDFFDEVLSGLQLLNEADFSDIERATFANDLRSMIGKHRTYSDAEWALDEVSLSKFDTVLHRFTPKSPGKRYAHLFSHQVSLASGEPEDYQEHEANVLKARRSCISELLTDDLSNFHELVVLAEVPHFIGTAIADAFIEDDGVVCFDRLMSWHGGESSGLRDVAVGFCRRRYFQKQVHWIWNMLARFTTGLSSAGLASIALCANATREHWHHLDALNPEVGAEYWRKINVYAIRDEDAEDAAERLIQNGRGFSTVSLLAHIDRKSNKDVPSELKYRALESALASDPEKDRVPSDAGWSVQRLLKSLEPKSRDDSIRKGKIEWAFMPIVKPGRFREGKDEQLYLHQMLCEEPKFFVEVISAAYRPASERGREDRPEYSEEEKQRALNAFNLLSTWTVIPGMREASPELRVATLQGWFNNARIELEKADRLEVGETVIGEMLSSSEGGSDGLWPDESVRNVIEKAMSEDIDSGFVIGVLNSRGVFSRSVGEGGKQERELAAKYSRLAASMQMKHPKTAALLRRISDHYTREAIQEDTDAEIDQDRGR